LKPKTKVAWSFAAVGVNLMLCLFFGFVFATPIGSGADLVFLFVTLVGAYLNYSTGVKQLSLLELRKESDMKSG
jgi:hypothetical protein